MGEKLSSRSSRSILPLYTPMVAKKKTVDQEARHVAELVTSGPLAGKRILVTRALKQADGLSSLLRQFGAEVIEAPVIEIRPPDSYEALDTALNNIPQYDWLILTSVNGVEALFSRLEPLGLNVDSLQHLKIAAIGPVTEERIQDHGLVVDIVPQRYVAEDVVRSLRKLTKGEKVLLVRAKVARDVIPEELRHAGAEVDVAEAYQTVIPEDAKDHMRQAFSNGRLPDAITFTSSSTVKNFLAVVTGTDVPAKLSKVKFASIGPVTSDTLREHGLPVHVEADEYTMEGLVQALIRLFGS
jgi:uroporphyrinogen-III synthase